jgi:hypothetical protein
MSIFGDVLEIFLRCEIVHPLQRLRGLEGRRQGGRGVAVRWRHKPVSDWLALSHR